MYSDTMVSKNTQFLYLDPRTNIIKIFFVLSKQETEIIENLLEMSKIMK